MHLNREILAFVSAAFMAGSAVAANAPVAQLQDASGKVLVNQGQGFIPAKGLVALNAGDKIMVGKDSSASVVYTAAGCKVDLAAATVMAVEAAAPCAAGETLAAVDSVFVHSASAQGFSSSAMPLPVLIGLTSFAGLMTVAIIEDKKNDNSVSSP